MGQYEQYVFAWGLDRDHRPQWSAAFDRLRDVRLDDYDGFHQEAASELELHELLSTDLETVRAAMKLETLITTLELGPLKVYVLAATVWSTADETPYDDLWESTREVFKSHALEAAGFQTATNL